MQPCDWGGGSWRHVHFQTLACRKSHSGSSQSTWAMYNVYRRKRANQRLAQNIVSGMQLLTMSHIIMTEHNSLWISCCTWLQTTTKAFNMSLFKLLSMKNKQLTVYMSRAHCSGFWPSILFSMTLVSMSFPRSMNCSHWCTEAKEERGKKEERRKKEERDNKEIIVAVGGSQILLQLHGTRYKYYY